MILKEQCFLIILTLFFIFIFGITIPSAQALPASHIFRASSDSRAVVERVVVFGDSLSDTGNLQALFKELTGQSSSVRIIEKPFLSFISKSRLPLSQELELILRLQESVDLAVKMIEVSGALAVIPDPPYYKGRFSNGPVWSEWMGKNLHGVDVSNSSQFINRAYGGSFAIGLKDQLTLDLSHPLKFMERLAASLKMIIDGKLLPPSLDYLIDAFIIEYAGTSPQPATLYTILAGGNDYLNTDVDDIDDSDSAQRVVDSICHNAEKIANFALNNRAPHSHVGLMTLPDLSLAPRFSTPHFNHQKPLIHRLVQKHNKKLGLCQQKLNAIPKYRNRVSFLMMDAAVATESVINSLPDDFNHTDACFPGIPFSTAGNHFPELPTPLKELQVNNHGSACTNPDQYVFWDDIHPTRVVHAKVFQYLCMELSKKLQMNCYIPEALSNKFDWPEPALNP